MDHLGTNPERRIRYLESSGELVLSIDYRCDDVKESIAELRQPLVIKLMIPAKSLSL
jgi:hypothetical protein